jgi:hypothetical protein
MFYNNIRKQAKSQINTGKSEKRRQAGVGTERPHQLTRLFLHRVLFYRWHHASWIILLESRVANAVASASSRNASTSLAGGYSTMFIEILALPAGIWDGKST